MSAYLTSLPSPVVPRISRATVPQGVGETLAINGDWSRSIPECVVCHGPGGVGVGDAFPPLAGQPERYLIAQFNAWRNGTRTNDPLDLMGHIARALTDEEIKAVSAYFAALGREEGR